MVVIILRNQVGINMLVTICEVFSRKDFFFEEGVYWVYTTDEERNIDRKDEQNILTI